MPVIFSRIMASVTPRGDRQVFRARPGLTGVIEQAEEVRAEAGVAGEDPRVLAPVPQAACPCTGPCRSITSRLAAGAAICPAMINLPVAHRGDLAGDHYLPGGDQQSSSLSCGVGQDRAGEAPPGRSAP